MLIDKYKLIVFDLDGTLVHTTAEYRYFIVPSVLKKLGKNPDVDLKLIDKFWFDAGRDETILKEFRCDPLKFWKEFHKLDKIEERKKYTHIYNDVWESLKRLKKMGKLLAITTGAPKKLARMETNLLPKDLFTNIIYITSTRYKGKPHPDSLIGCLKFCKAKPQDTVYIGNSTEDGKYAEAANVDFIYLERREHQFKGETLTTMHSLQDLFLD